MVQQGKKNTETNLDTQLLSDFIYELNIARRQLSLYPPGHPKIIESSQTALQVLQDLCEFRETITLGVSPEALLFEQAWLDENNPVYRDFAHFLSQLGIASISFSLGLNTDELAQFNQLLRQDRKTIETGGGFSSQLEQYKISHIAIKPVDYSLFHSNEDLDQPPRQTEDSLWEDFLHGLLNDQLDSNGEAGNLNDEFNAAAIADILNQRASDNPEEDVDYEQVISSFIGQLPNRGRQGQNVNPGRQLSSLLNNLNPVLRKRFLNSTFMALDRHPDKAESVLSDFPQELLVETLQQQSQAQMGISSRLVDMLGQLTTDAPTQSAHQVATSNQTFSKDILQARMEILFIEDNHDTFIPEKYQQALQTILQGDIQGTVPQPIELKLKKTLEKQSVERQCCAVIFNMLSQAVDQELESILQNNLVELAQYFLDTGDFISLRAIYIRWSNYYLSGKAHVSPLDERVLANQTREVFMTEVLNNIELWGKEKYSEICDYIVAVGEPYAELLVTQLGEEKQMQLRRTWMKLLIELGAKSAPLVVQNLRDKRWYLVRNLLIILSRQNAAIPLKAVHPLAAHAHPKVRQEALRILLKHNPATANRLLLKELGGHDHLSLYCAAQVADLSRDDAVIRQLHQMLESDKLSEADLELKIQLVNTLGRIGRPDTVPVFNRLLKKKGLLRARRLQQLQLEIIRNLSNFPAASVGPILKSLRQSRNREQSALANKQLQHLAGNKR